MEMMFATARDMANDISILNKLTAMIQKAEIDGRWQIRFSDDVFVDLIHGEKVEIKARFVTRKMVRVAVLCGGMRVCQFGIPADETIEAETGWGFVKLSISEVG